MSSVICDAIPSAPISYNLNVNTWLCHVLHRPVRGYTTAAVVYCVLQWSMHIPQFFPVPQSIDFGQLQRAFEASTRGAEEAAGLPPRPVQGVASLPDLSEEQLSSLRQLGLRHIAEVSHRCSCN